MKIDVNKLVLGAVNTNAYIVGIEGECIIIDPSAEAEKIIALIEEKGFTPVAILLTHGHFDHAMAAREVADRYHIKIYASEAEEKLLSDPNINLAAQFLGGDFSLTPDIFVKGGEELSFNGFKIKVIETPGHTRGSVSYYSEDLEGNEEFQRVLFSGDSVFAGSIGRVDFPTGNEAAMRRTIHSVLKQLPDDTFVFSGHGIPTTIGREKKTNPYFL